MGIVSGLILISAFLSSRSLSCFCVSLFTILSVYFVLSSSAPLPLHSHSHGVHYFSYIIWKLLTLSSSIHHFVWNYFPSLSPNLSVPVINIIYSYLYPSTFSFPSPFLHLSYLVSSVGVALIHCPSWYLSIFLKTNFKLQTSEQNEFFSLENGKKKKKKITFSYLFSSISSSYFFFINVPLVKGTFFCYRNVENGERKLNMLENRFVYSGDLLSKIYEMFTSVM